MNQADAALRFPKSVITLSQLLFQSRNGHTAGPSLGVNSAITEFNREEFQDLLTLANLNHVVVRGMEAALKVFWETGDEMRIEWAVTALGEEQARIDNAMPFLQAVCSAFQEEGHDVAVIKSLDHWPDLGSDLDLYSNANPVAITELMTRRFKAEIEPRSWGDRLACKWNFLIPGLPAPIEIHMGRLGQTGEQIAMGKRVIERAQWVRIGDYTFPVPAVSERLMISTLQRMYRHFYFRLCDIVDTAALSYTGQIDYDDLRNSAMMAGIWEGVATYLTIVSDYVKENGGEELNLPIFVKQAARFGGQQVYFRKDFLRVPIMPQAANLYGTQLAGMLRKRELSRSARLGLLPWLATAAAMGHKLTGSDKGIW